MMKLTKRKWRKLSSLGVDYLPDSELLQFLKLLAKKSDARGLTNIEDIVRFLPQNFSTITNGGSFDNRSPRFQIGSVTLNLRGLGEGSTLVLVNGKRLAASPVRDWHFYGRFHSSIQRDRASGSHD